MLAIVGAGVQGEHHLRTFPLVRDFDEIRVASLYAEDAQRLAALHPRAPRSTTPAAAVARRRRRGARHARRAAGRRAGLDRARHARQLGRLPPAATASCRARCSREHSLFVETREAFEPTPVGCAELAGPATRARATELGEVLLGRAPGRRDATRSPSTRRWATSSRTSWPPSSSTPRPTAAARSSRSSALLGDELVEPGLGRPADLASAGTASSRAAGPSCPAPDATTSRS